MIFGRIASCVEEHHDGTSVLTDNNDIQIGIETESPDQSSVFSQSDLRELTGENYKNPYQPINLENIEMQPYSFIDSQNYQNTEIFPSYMWDRRTFIVVFLKVLQVIGNIILDVIGNIQEVLVRTGDTIILNCTCISQINGNWVGPNRSSSKTISFNEEKLIPYTEGFRVNKKLNISNINVVGSYENRTCNLVITKFSTDDEGKYKCQYVENNITNSRVYKVLLQRPPTNLTIANATQNDTLQVVDGNMLQLVCSVKSGKPNEILQWITDRKVVQERGHNGTITYRLNASSSDHMKIFICSAMNEALDHPITKQVRLDVLGKPKVTVSIIPDGRFLQEYQDAELCCKTKGNPAATHITWIKDTTNIKRLNDTRHCISFTPLRRKHNGNYTCTAINSIGFSSATKHIRVLYPPDVSINTQESEKTITLKCHASGNPGSYKFAKWEHQSELGKHIRYIGNPRNGTLVLEKHNYQNSGIYKCSVKNGIPDMNGELYQKELVMVDYKGPPVFVSNNSKTWFAQYHEDGKIIVKVLSSSNITRGQIRKIEIGHTEEQSFESIRSFIMTTCRESLVFYNVNVLVECIELTFELNMSGNIDLRNYTVEVCNTFNCSRFEVTVVLARESVDNLLYLSTEFRPSHSARNQTEVMEMNIQMTGFNQTISTLSSHYQEERPVEQNVRDSNRIIPTQHAESILNYAEIEFEARPTASTSIIHGHEDRTIYSEIDLLRLANVIPSISDSDEDDFMYVDGIENYKKKD
ncbi:unnamed protein product [Mytilus coruscus]|uniref:Ig-like domain-containing protein n=1 Tax=Mytilus coruscus TaxID=42192 RepID=A0A6J8BHW0_MYTCO|nr:unnamed protein product [Mytilus coruscus]